MIKVGGLHDFDFLLEDVDGIFLMFRNRVLNVFLLR